MLSLIAFKKLIFDHQDLKPCNSARVINNYSLSSFNTSVKSVFF